MSVTFSIESNVDEVIDSIDDVKDDLRAEMKKRVGAAMAAVQTSAKQYVEHDADYTGDLQRAIGKVYDTSGGKMEFKVFTNADIAPYAAIVEFGSGSRSGVSYDGSVSAQPPENYPADYPFSSPDIRMPSDDITSLTHYPKFRGFVGYIMEWMENKPVQPQTGDLFLSAVLIARTIVEKGNYAHPFLRPAWFDNELKVKKAARNAVKNATR